MPMRPFSPVGNPRVTGVHVSPPSVDLYSREPEPVGMPPKLLRWRVYVDARMTRGFVGSNATSLAPVFSSTYNTFFHVRPPSVVLKSPRSGLGPRMLPCAATKTTSGFAASIAIRPMWRDSARPMRVHVFPASIDLNTPSPHRCGGFSHSPVPTHTMSGFDGAM